MSVTPAPFNVKTVHLVKFHGTYMFISEPYKGNWYIAERSYKGNRKLLWSIMPELPIRLDTRIEAKEVPASIRRKAYRILTTGE